MNFITIGLLLVILVGFAPKSKGQTTSQNLSRNVEYDVTINNFAWISNLGLEELNHSWFRDNLEASVRGAFVELLFKNAKDGKLELYDMNDKRIDAQHIRALFLGPIDTVTMNRSRPPYDSYDTIIPKSIPSEEITALRFREEWTYDPSTMAISKKVLAYAPIWTPIILDNNNHEIFGKGKAMFWVKWSKNPSKTKVLTKRIMSAVILGSSDELYKTINVDKAAIETYSKQLIEKVLNDKIKVYNCYSGDIADEYVNGKEMYNQLYRIDTIELTKPVAPYDRYDTILFSKPHIDFIRFMEEWYFDEATMAIEKKVVGVCPLQKLFDENMVLKGYRVYFWTYFADIWMPLEGKVKLK